MNLAAPLRARNGCFVYAIGLSPICISSAPIFMPLLLDPEVNNAAFIQPRSDGSFPPDFEAYLNELGDSRPSVVLAFAPKAAYFGLEKALYETMA